MSCWCLDELMKQQSKLLEEAHDFIKKALVMPMRVRKQPAYRKSSSASGSGWRRLMMTGIDSTSMSYTVAAIDDAEWGGRCTSGRLGISPANMDGMTTHPTTPGGRQRGGGPAE